MDLGTIQYDVEANTSDLDKAAADFDSVADKADKAGSSVDAAGKKIEKGGKAAANGLDTAAKSSKNMSNAARNLGQQLQDVIVQMQSGTSAAVIFSQQGSQLFSSIHPLVGLAAALAGVIGGALYTALGNATDNTKDLDAAIQDLHKNYKDLDTFQKQARIFGEIDKQNNAKKQISDLQTEITQLSAAYDSLATKGKAAITTTSFGGQVTRYVAATTEELAAAERKLIEARGKLSDQNSILLHTQREIQRINGIAVEGDKESISAAEQQIKSLKERNAELKINSQFMTEGAEGTKEYIAAYADMIAEKSNGTAAEKEAIRNLVIANKTSEESIRITQKATAEEKQRSDAYTKYLNNLRAELTLSDKKSAYDKAIFDISNDILKVRGGINGAEAQSILLAAQRVDKLRDEAELLKEINGYIDDASRTREKSIEDAVMGNFDKVDENVKKTFKTAEKFAQDSAERINGAFADAWVNIANDADNAFDGIRNAFLQILAEMANDAITKPIVMNITQMASGSGGSLFAGIGGGGGLAAAGIMAGIGLINSWNKKQEEAIKEFTSEFRQGFQSTGTVLGANAEKSNSIANSLDYLNSIESDLLGVNQSMLSALNDIRDGIGKASALVARSGISSPEVSGLGTSTNSNIGRAGLSAITGGGSLLIEGVANLLGDDIGGFVNGIIGSVSKAIYSKTKKVVDSGIQFSGQTLADIMAGGTLDAFTYASINTKKKVLGITTSNKVKDELNGIGDGLERQFALVFQGAGQALDASATAFGLNFDDYINNLTVDAQKLSLKGLKGDELTAELEKFFSSTMDKWAETIVSGTGILEQFQQVGEGAFETVTRLAGELNVFNKYADLLGLNFKAVGFNAVEITQNIAKLSGGFDALQQNLSGYYQNFFSESERSSAQMDMLAEQLKNIGVDTVPATRDAFRDLIEAQDLSTESGQKMFANLLGLQGVFADLVPATEKITDSLESMKNAASSAADALFRSIDAERDRINSIIDAAQSAKTGLEASIGAERNRVTQAYNDRIKMLESLADEERKAAQAQADAAYEAEKAIAKARAESLKDQIKELGDSLGGLHSLFDKLTESIYGMAVETKQLTAARRESAKSFIDDAIAAAKSTGQLPTSDAIEKSLSVLTQDSSALFSSRSEMMRDVAITQNKLAKLADITGGQISEQEKQLDILGKQLESAQLAYDQVEKQTVTFVSKYDEMIEQAKTSYEDEMAYYDNILLESQKQFDKLTGIDTSVLSVSDAIDKFDKALAAANFENAQAQLGKLDEIESNAKMQLDALNGIDTSILSLNESFSAFIDAMNLAAANNSAVQLQTLNALVSELQTMRAENAAAYGSLAASSAKTASNTTSLYKDGVQIIS